MFVNFQVPQASMIFLPQDSQLTCWAARAAGVKSAKAGKMLNENAVLTSDYLSLFNSKTSLSLVQIRDCYKKPWLTETKFDLRSRKTVNDFIKDKLPVIASSAVAQFPPNGAPIHLAYHVRLVYGATGDLDSSKEGDYHVRIFDPFPSPGSKPQTQFLFSHFKFQMSYNSRSVAGAVGLAWYG